ASARAHALAPRRVCGHWAETGGMERPAGAALDQRVLRGQRAGCDHLPGGALAGSSQQGDALAQEVVVEREGVRDAHRAEMGVSGVENLASHLSTKVEPADVRHPWEDLG